MADDDVDTPLLPMEIISLILPHSFDTLSQALSLMLVCKDFRAEAESTTTFWSLWLQRFYRQLLLDLEQRDSQLMRVVSHFYVMIPQAILERGGMLAVIRSKLPATPNSFFGSSCNTQLFEGTFDAEGNRSGPCAVYYADGDAYQGQMIDGMYDGQGEVH
jgi:hypothetical protein